MCKVGARVCGRPGARNKQHAWYVSRLLAAVHWHMLASDGRMRTMCGCSCARSASAPATRRRRRPRKVPWHCRLPPRRRPRHRPAQRLRSCPLQAQPPTARLLPAQRSPQRRRRPPRRWHRPARQACCQRCWDWRRAPLPLQLCPSATCCLRNSHMYRSASTRNLLVHAFMQVPSASCAVSILTQSGCMSLSSCARALCMALGSHRCRACQRLCKSLSYDPDTSSEA